MPPFNSTISSRKIEDLLPVVGHKAIMHIHACKQAGIDLLITGTYRCAADQNKLYAQGRTTPGHVVTNAKAGESLHQYRVAYDVVPLRDGKPVWGTTTPEDKQLWQAVGELGLEQGLEWAGDWTSFKEFPHFQYTGGLTLADFKAGRRPHEPHEALV